MSPDRPDLVRLWLQAIDRALHDEDVPKPTRIRILNRIMVGHPDGINAAIRLVNPDAGRDAWALTADLQAAEDPARFQRLHQGHWIDDEEPPR